MRPLVSIFKVSAIAALCLFAATAARGQDLDDVSFAGTVSDQNGAALTGAKVTATLVSTKSVRAASTDAEGRYRLVELQPGAYTLRVEAAGFATEARADVQTIAGQSVRLDFKLKPAGVEVEQTIVSDAEAPAIDTTRTVTGGTIAREEIERLPTLTRAPLDFVFTLGGV
ncbi:MAG: carboxypeptidase-like regulatory domain-containing protein, partial [Pyrinomonadaceae bacterium]